jgi:glycosyltransferase involved in cell wall biosynthesis
VRTDETPLVSVLIPHYNLGQYLPATLVSVLEQTYPNIEIIIVDDCSTDANSKGLIEELRSNPQSAMQVIVAPGNLGLGAARNLAIANAKGKYIVPVDADDLLDRRFVELAVGALQRNPEFDVVVSPAGYFHDGHPVVLPGENADFADYAIFVGEALVGGFEHNRFSTATAVFRGDVLRTYRYNESLRSYEDWNLYLRLARDGLRFLVTTDVYFHYRNRPNSMIKQVLDWSRHALFVHDNLRTALNVARLTPLAYLALCPVEPPVPQVREIIVRADQPAVYLEAVNALAAAIAKQLVHGKGVSNPGFFRRAASWLRRPGEPADEVRCVLDSSVFFDREWYLDVYPDVRDAQVDPVEHYICHGAKEGRNPSPFFSTSGYLAANPDVEASKMNPLFHYLRFGFKERRRMQP